jgi:cytochrome c oxidase subunit 1
MDSAAANTAPPVPAWQRGRFASWLVTVDHKRIGILYVATAGFFFGAAGIMSLLIRAQLAQPDLHVVTRDSYNELITIHGTAMIFLFVVPILTGLANFLVPLMIGAPDMAFPRLNALSYWLYAFAGGVLMLSFFSSGGAARAGWTSYVPLSIQSPGHGQDLWILSLHLLTLSSLVGAINFITTIHNMRTPGMTWTRMPLFVWSIEVYAVLLVVILPVIGGGLLLLLLDRQVGTHFFLPDQGGNAILYQHFFWFFGHPEVYVIILPAMGMISEIIPVFARKPIFGYKMIAFSSLAIAAAGSLVWGHHMFTSGMSDTARVIFSFVTFLVAVPSGVKIFNWISTLYKGSISLDAPLIFALSFIFLFSIGGLTGLIIGSLAPNLHLHGTYFIVGHFHYVMFGGAGFSILAGLHYWFPKITGRMYSERQAKIGWLSLFVGFNVLYFSMFILGYQGMPRRYFDYPPQYHMNHVISTIGSWFLAVGLIIIFANLIRSIFKGERAPMNPWGGKTLEWTIPSPPRRENFREVPVITRGPYPYDEEAQR